MKERRSRRPACCLHARAWHHGAEEQGGRPADGEVRRREVCPRRRRRAARGPGLPHDLPFKPSTKKNDWYAKQKAEKADKASQDVAAMAAEEEEEEDASSSEVDGGAQADGGYGAKVTIKVEQP